MFSRVRSAGLTPGDAPVYVNVYDLTPANGYFYWAGLGIFHSGIEELVPWKTEENNCREWMWCPIIPNADLVSYSKGI
ncbi:hypothetical protein ACLOJK_041088 [Asimina triloba]